MIRLKTKKGSWCELTTYPTYYKKGTCQVVSDKSASILFLFSSSPSQSLLIFFFDLHKAKNGFADADLDDGFHKLRAIYRYRCAHRTILPSWNSRGSPRNVNGVARRRQMQRRRSWNRRRRREEESGSQFELCSAYG